MGETIESVSIYGGSTLRFHLSGYTIESDAFGAKLHAEARRDGGADLRLVDETGFVLANLIINPRNGVNLTQNVIDIGSALLWSHELYLKAKAAEVVPTSP